MPELPEVETVVRELREAGLEGVTISRARLFWAKICVGVSVRRFSDMLQGQCITSIARRGKFIVLRLSGLHDLLIHLRMTGQLRFDEPSTARDKHEHVILDFEDGRQLRFRDPRKFGRWYLLKDIDCKLGALGPEPLEARFRASDFVTRLSQRRGMLKPLLLNQAFLAGIGNIYADEALWDAGLHPQRRAETLSDSERGRLYRSIRKVLRRGVLAMGTSLGHASTNFYSVSGRRGRNKDGLRVFRRTGEPCPRCGSAVQRIIVGQRSTHICARCQPPEA